MRCHVCDKALTDAEIQVSPSGVGYEPCIPCMEVAMDAAYSDGFVREEPLDDPELNDEFGDGAVEVLDPDTFLSDGSGFQLSLFEDDYSSH